jgi:hypothetical protein
MSKDNPTAYFDELTQRFQRERIAFDQPEGDRLPILLDDREIGIVTPSGSMRVRGECIDDPAVSDLYHRAGAVAAEVHEYMELMKTAPLLKASSLPDPYKQLADFNGFVLGGMESKHGVQFTTWQWSYDRDGLTLGHYCGNDYAAAKKDFALRCGLVQEQKQFSPEQLIEIYRCCADTMSHDYELTYEQEKLIDEIKTMITEMVPDYAERMNVSLESDPSQQMQQTM